MVQRRCWCTKMRIVILQRTATASVIILLSYIANSVSPWQSSRPFAVVTLIRSTWTRSLLFWTRPSPKCAVVAAVHELARCMRIGPLVRWNAVSPMLACHRRSSRCHSIPTRSRFSLIRYRRSNTASYVEQNLLLAKCGRDVSHILKRWSSFPPAWQPVHVNSILPRLLPCCPGGCGSSRGPCRCRSAGFVRRTCRMCILYLLCGCHNSSESHRCCRKCRALSSCGIHGTRRLELIYQGYVRIRVEGSLPLVRCRLRLYFGFQATCCET